MSGNPFATSNPFTEWTSNNLILKDPALRQRAGVTVLDHNVSEMFPGKQFGGRASGAPMYRKVDNEQKGGMPYHYFNNNKRW